MTRQAQWQGCAESDMVSIPKSEGLTPTERLLNRLCERTFLRLWTYPRVFRDQGGGHEICDQLAVFGETLVIFSDKRCEFREDIPIATAWSRWRRDAIDKSVGQVLGAERWLRAHPNRVFLDAACSKRLPFDLAKIRRVHRVVTAAGAANACRRCWGGTGSLMQEFGTHFLPDLPFQIQHPRDREIVHVFDEVGLDLVLRHLDTSEDFIRYLASKERLLSTGINLRIAGEEELLSVYFAGHDARGEPEFPSMIQGSVSLAEGGWDVFRNSPRFAARAAAIRVGYWWDGLLEQFSASVLDGTMLDLGDGGTDRGFVGHERRLRALARPSRLARSQIARAFIETLRNTASDETATRLITTPLVRDTLYLLLIVPRDPDDELIDYRRYRAWHLQALCAHLLETRRNLVEVVGIATGPMSDPTAATDEIVAITREEWGCHLSAAAEWFRAEYPDFRTQLNAPRNSYGRAMKVGRNQPCPCGSGRKFKKCHGGADPARPLAPS